jgi:hypothetical protein
VCAYVTRDSTQPRLDRSFTPIRRHRAMSAEQRLLGGLVGIGLGAEQRHAQTAEHAAVLACACRECFAVLTPMEQGNDRIGAWLVYYWQKGTSLHFRPHVRPCGRFVTFDLRKSDKCRGSIAIFVGRWERHLRTNALPARQA